MKPSTFVIIAAAAVIVGAAAPRATTAVVYQLGDDADFETGCFAPCECPVLIHSPLKGTFVLTPAGFDGLYRHYDVTGVDWRLPGQGAETRTAGADDVTGIPALRASPNPFADQTRIRFALREAGPVFAAVHEPSGRRVRTLATGEVYGSGLQGIVWDGRRDDGRPAGAGVDFVSLRAAGQEIRGAVVRISP